MDDALSEGRNEEEQLTDMTVRKELVALISSTVAAAAFGAIELGQPFSDGMVLQRELRAPVWGRATPGSAVTVSFGGQTLETFADTNGAWRVAFQFLEASAVGRELTVVETVSKAGLTFGDTIDAKTVKDVLVGEVWFASGQSNMECPIWGSCPRYRDANGAMAVAMTHKPLVRFVKVGRDFSLTPKFRTEKASGWKKLVPSSIDPNQEITFSAVAFYFALELHNALGIPVGIVDASYGGTNIDAWTPRCAYANCDPALKPIADYPLHTKEEWTKERDTLGPIDRHDQQPTIIFNAMVAPFAPMAVRGFLWYQGCNNAWDKPQIFCTRLHALYDGWSAVFERPDLSMLMVHLAPWCNWMSIWREQNKFAAEEPNCALAVTADIGNPKDIHPADKLTVARRLAFQALKRNYGFPIPETDAPTIKSVVFDGNTATLTFDHVKRWYFYSPDKSEAIPFEMAGEDGKWHPAKFENAYQKGWNLGIVSGSEIRLSCEQVSVAKRVRYMGTGGGNGTLFSFETSLPLTPFER